jgi:glycosyltransferase involved in cell wall biosynthesis
MRVVILKRSKVTAKDTGVDVYSNNVEKALATHGIPFEAEKAVMDTKAGYLKFLMDGIVRPFVNIIRRKDGCIYHATDELCCLFFPFAKGKKIITFHHVVRDSDKDMKGTLIWRLAARIGLRYADTVIAISPQTKKELIDAYDLPEDRVVTILSGGFDAFVTLNDVKRERTVGCVSTFIQRKNVGALIRAFSILAATDGMGDVKLKICGKGPEKASLEELAASLGISDRVVFFSDITTDELVMFYNSITVLANPSMHEGFGNVTQEAQRCSAPVVFFRNAKIPAEVTRFAVPCDSEEDMAGKMRLLFTDRDMNERIVREGKEYADAFGQEFANGIVAIYREHIDGMR